MQSCPARPQHKQGKAGPSAKKKMAIFSLFSQMFYMSMEIYFIFCVLTCYFSVPHLIFGFFLFKHKGLKSSIMESKGTTAIFDVGRRQWDSSHTSLTHFCISKVFQKIKSHQLCTSCINSHAIF